MKGTVRGLLIAVMAVALIGGSPAAAYAQVDFDPATFLKDLDVGIASSGQPGAGAVGAPGISSSVGGPAPAPAATVHAAPGRQGSTAKAAPAAKRPIAPAAVAPAAAANNPGPSGGSGSVGGGVGSATLPAARTGVGAEPLPAVAPTSSEAGGNLARTGDGSLPLVASFVALFVLGCALKRDLFLGR